MCEIFDRAAGVSQTGDERRFVVAVPAPLLRFRGEPRGDELPAAQLPHVSRHGNAARGRHRAVVPGHAAVVALARAAGLGLRHAGAATAAVGAIDTAAVRARLTDLGERLAGAARAARQAIVGPAGDRVRRGRGTGGDAAAVTGGAVAVGGGGVAGEGPAIDKEVVAGSLRS